MLINIYFFPSLCNSFSLVTPFGNVEINLDFICSCQCEKDENLVRFLYIIHVFRTTLITKGTCTCNVGIEGARGMCSSSVFVLNLKLLRVLVFTSPLDGMRYYM